MVSYQPYRNASHCGASGMPLINCTDSSPTALNALTMYFNASIRCSGGQSATTPDVRARTVSACENFMLIEEMLISKRKCFAVAI